LERAAVSGRAAGQITFVGARANVADYLRAADLLVLPSRAEGMSNVLLEAMACGIPAVATDVNGNREVIGEEGQAGRLVPPGDPAALAEAIDKFLGGPAFRQETGAVARSIVAERFDIRRVVTQYASLYEELQGGRERSARPRS
jgi:glycosyltransferase involved in cell wall biosynthesis